MCCYSFCFFFFKQKTAYEMRISDWSSDVCSSDLERIGGKDLWREVFHGAPDKTRILLGGRLCVQRPHDTALGIGRGHHDLLLGGAEVLELEDLHLAVGGADHDQRRVFQHVAVIEDLSGVEIQVRSEEHTSELQSLMRLS